MFAEHDKKTDDFILHIKMELARTSLADLVKDKPPMSFQEFFPVFRDYIFGITYMHS